VSRIFFREEKNAGRRSEKNRCDAENFYHPPRHKHYILSASLSGIQSYARRAAPPTARVPRIRRRNA
ncbi:MAG: hypothetical protein ACKO7R_08360, partial [Pseudanabaena sp.]